MHQENEIPQTMKEPSPMNSIHPEFEEFRTIRAMITLYCHDHHGGGSQLCSECRHCWIMQDFGSKSVHSRRTETCANCAVHCYTRSMREKVKEVMRYSALAWPTVIDTGFLSPYGWPQESASPDGKGNYLCLCARWLWQRFQSHNSGSQPPPSSPASLKEETSGRRRELNARSLSAPCALPWITSPGVFPFLHKRDNGEGVTHLPGWKVWRSRVPSMGYYCFWFFCTLSLPFILPAFVHIIRGWYRYLPSFAIVRKAFPCKSPFS